MTETLSLDLPVVGVTVDPMTAIEAAKWASNSTGKRLLLNHNLHSVYLFQKDAAFRAFYARADRTVIDGAPVLALAKRKARGLSSSHRIGSTDWIGALSQTSRPGRLLVFGSTEDSNRAAVANLRLQLESSGWFVDGLHGYTRSDRVISWLHQKRPTLVIVGLGMPLQETFLDDHWEQLPDAVYATVGGAIDYVAGEVRLAPRWLGSLGLEWLWRLVHAPKRLAHRYLIEPLLLGWALATRERSRTSLNKEAND